MVNFHDPAVIAQNDWTRVKFWHVLSGIYLWEFFTTLNYEWRVIRGRSPYRWTIWIYSLTRVAGLIATILTLVGMDVSTSINCQLWYSSTILLCYLSAAAGSLLIVLRVIAIWNNKTVIRVTTIGVWGINVIFLIQGVARLRDAREPPGCVPLNTRGNLLTLIAMAITDITLLVIMLAGLFRLRQCGGGTFGLAQFLWKQGVIWILLAAAAEIPPAVLIVLDLNDEYNTTFQVPSFLTMVIAASRMHRGLVEFTSRSPSVTNENIQNNGLVFSKTKHIHAKSIPVKRVSLAADEFGDQHPTYHLPSISTDDEVHEKLETQERQSDLHLDSDDNVYCGV